MSARSTRVPIWSCSRMSLLYENRSRIPSTMRRWRHWHGDDVYMAILAAGGYEYTVALLAILALGAAVTSHTGSAYRGVIDEEFGQRV
ncbi:hypothetical protein EJ02DRAFT_455615 [Clathrospora elynae]|uniref:Uncharacterized protein n=1 Tax=Clathrospora elynae TaxID=706981 RepID=A0A6A5SLD4_9PLEO|nr:hypothetical protein EJ02DRAFT_455615 [Clathrospora elynae]